MNELDQWLRLVGFDWQLVHDAALTGLNVLMLFFFLSYFLFDSVRDFLARRQQKIAGQLKAAADHQQEAETLKQEYEEQLKEIRSRKEEILAEAKQQAGRFQDQILSDARSEAGRILERGILQLRQEQQKAEEEEKDEMVSLAVLLAGKAVRDALTPELQNRLIENALKEIGEETVWGQSRYMQRHY